MGSATPSGNVAHFVNSTGSCYINPTTTSLSCSSDIRLKKNIADINASSTLAGVLALNPVSYNWKTEATSTSPHTGFIAQAVQLIFPDLVSQGPDGFFTLNYAGFAPYIVKAIQSLAADVTSLQQTVAGFADNFVSTHITVTTLDAAVVHSQEDDTQKPCVGSICVTPAQFQAMVAAAGGNQSPSAPQPGPAGTSTSPGFVTWNSSASSTPPTISINGDNPAIIQVGDTYSDLGATITGPTADINLGIKTFLNGALVSNIVIDTTAVATDTIDYVATDAAGLTSTSTRMVLIQAPSIVPTDASSTATSSAQ